MARRNWRYFSYLLLQQLANDYNVDVAEILQEYMLSDREIRNFYKYWGSYEI